MLINRRLEESLKASKGSDSSKLYLLEDSSAFVCHKTIEYSLIWRKKVISSPECMLREA